jgi:Flp pilus assembly protein TadB
MSTDVTFFPAAFMLAFVLTWPAVLAAWRRGVNREASDVAAALEAFAERLRRTPGSFELDPALAARMARLRMPELDAFHLAGCLPNASPALVADAAARLSLRLRRRIAFERKMLARTASGRRRGAIAGAVPPLVLLILGFSGADFPRAALLLVAFALALGCWLQARIARVVP